MKDCDIAQLAVSLVVVLIFVFLTEAGRWIMGGMLAALGLYVFSGLVAEEIIGEEV